MDEVDGATTRAHNIRDPAIMIADALRKECIIKCICGLTRFEDGDCLSILRCNSCKTTQHMRCYYVNEHGMILNFPDLFRNHSCIDCKPRPLDAELATTRQMLRKKRHSEYLNLRELMVEKQEEFRQDATVPRSAQEEEFLRTLICHHGTNWLAIANDMEMRESTMVCDYWVC